MHARTIAFRVRPDRVDDAVRFFRESVGELEGLPGLERALFLLDRQSGRAMTMTLWATEADLQASAERAAQIFTQAAEFIEGVPDRRSYEVAFQAGGGVC